MYRRRRSRPGSDRRNRYYESYPGECDLDSVQTCLTGLGIGLLVSAALSVAPALADLPTAGAEVVRVAFRLGIVVNEVSQHLEPRDLTGCLDSWAYVIPDVVVADVQKALDALQPREVSLMEFSYYILRLVC